MKKIGSGAEATIFLDDGKVIKKRLKKNYRIAAIDNSLRKSRTRREAKILEKIDIPAPNLISDDREETIEMEYIKGKPGKELLDEKPKLAEEIGCKVAKMHNAGIIHGDLTTSNMMMREEIIFIDFGLSFFSDKIEDKAVDIHLLRQALESKHHTIWKEAYDWFLKGYKSVNKFESIMKRLEKVESRGRHKKK